MNQTSPSPPSEETLRIARTAAVDAQLEADRLDAIARKAQRKANSRRMHYENLLLVYQGQTMIPMEE